MSGIQELWYGYCTEKEIKWDLGIYTVNEYMPRNALKEKKKFRFDCLLKCKGRLKAAHTQKHTQQQLLNSPHLLS